MRNPEKHGNILSRGILNSLLMTKSWARDQKEVNRMNKYELALVVSAKIEDDARAAIVEKAKEYITRAGGTVTEVEDQGEKR